MKQSMEVLTSSETNEWYTPPRYIKAAKEVMGGIDLDPASSDLANRLVGAAVHITKEANGLTFRWFGNLWLNPPYGKTGNKSNQEIWARYLLKQYRAMNVCQAVLLTKTVPGYKWWDWMFHNWPGPLCITRGRIAFVKPERVRMINGQPVWTAPDSEVGRSKAASSFWYLGNRAKQFKEVFSAFGRCLDPMEKV